MNLYVLSAESEGWLPRQTPRMLLLFYLKILVWLPCSRSHDGQSGWWTSPAHILALSRRTREWKEQREPISHLSQPNVSGFPGSPIQHSYLHLGLHHSHTAASSYQGSWKCSFLFVSILASAGEKKHAGKRTDMDAEGLNPQYLSHSQIVFS